MLTYECVIYMSLIILVKVCYRTLRYAIIVRYDVIKYLLVYIIKYANDLNDMIF